MAMDDHTRGPGRSREEARCWRIRTALEAVNTTAWTVVFTLQALADAGWLPHL